MAAHGALTVLTAGYAAWTIRGGYLLSSLLSTLPAWRMMDPLPVLDSFQPLDDKRKHANDKNNESLEDIIEQTQISLRTNG